MFTCPCCRGSRHRSFCARKGATAREANRILGRKGEPFWQGESYDHWVRDERKWEKIAEYIEENAVKAGVAVTAAEYPCSSAVPSA